MNASPRKILIAEDNPGLARVLSFKFKASGFVPVTCADGQLAWDSYQKDDFVAVISDQEMPRMTGIDLCCNVRQQDARVPFFLVTGRQLELSATGISDELGITEIFAKPFSPGSVVAAVETAVQQNMGQQDVENEAAIS